MIILSLVSFSKIYNKVWNNDLRQVHYIIIVTILSKVKLTIFWIQNDIRNYQRKVVTNSIIKTFNIDIQGKVSLLPIVAIDGGGYSNFNPYRKFDYCQAANPDTESICEMKRSLKWKITLLP